MKRLLLLTLLCFSINGFAFNWKLVFVDSKGTSYHVDLDNIKKHNGIVYYWRLADYLEPIRGGNSSLNKYEVNCREEKKTLLRSTWYSQSMGKGRIVTDNAPNITSYPKSNLHTHQLMKLACKYAK